MYDPSLHNDYRDHLERNDKGQVRCTCKCGLKTNWHNTEWAAKHCIYELHSDPFKGRTLEQLVKEGVNINSYEKEIKYAYDGRSN